MCKGSCKTCGSKSHHTLLHFKNLSSPALTGGKGVVVSGSTGPNISELSDPPAATLTISVPQPVGVLMATCLAVVRSSNGGYAVVRAILDTASHASFITEACAARLGGLRFSAPVSISGVGDIVTQSRKVCHLSVETLSREVISKSHMFVVLPRITPDSPRFQVVPEIKQATEFLTLADPTFDVSAPVDALFGADIVAAVLMGETVPLGPGYPVAIRTRFGYVIMGRAPAALNCFLSCADGLSNLSLDRVAVHQLHCHYHRNFESVTTLITASSDLSQQVQRFWEVEEPPAINYKLSEEDKYVEEFYSASTIRLSSGRYQVRLPFKKGSHPNLGNSLKNAFSRFFLA